MILHLLLAAATPVGSAAAAPQKLEHAPAPLAAEALELATLLNPEKELVEVGVRGFEIGFQEGLRQNAEYADVFDAHPGLDKAIIAAAKPIMEADLRKDLPAIRQRYGRFYQAHLQPVEIRQLLAFYRSPTGAKVIAGMFAGLDLQSIAANVAQNEGTEVRPSDLSDALKATTRRILPAFDDSDRAALLTFMGTSAFRRLQQVNPKIMALHAEIANESDPELDTALDEAMEKAIEDFIAKSDAAASTG